MFRKVVSLPSLLRYGPEAQSRAPAATIVALSLCRHATHMFSTAAAAVSQEEAEGAATSQGRGRGRIKRRARVVVEDANPASTEGKPLAQSTRKQVDDADDREENVPIGGQDSLVYKTPKPDPLVSPLPLDTPEHVLERHKVRVDNLLAQAGFCSRKEARQFCRGYWVVALKPDGREERILTGKTKVLPWELRVEGGAAIEHAGKILTIAMHKPQGYVCTHADDEGESVYDLLPQTFSMRKPLLSSIGRLDKMSTGLLLFTQDGKLNSLLSNPGAQENGYGGCPKEYIVSLEEDLSEAGVEAAAFSSGRLQLVDGSICAPALLVPHSTKKNICKVTLGEGKHHQIRRMFAAIGHNVTGIHRISYGGLKLPDLGLKPGEWRVLEDNEVQRAIDAVTATKKSAKKDGTIQTGIKPTVPPMAKTALPFLGQGLGGFKMRLPRLRIAKEMPKLSELYAEQKKLLAAEADRMDKEEAEARAAKTSKKAKGE
jgi:16S rRNA pseudouridine516 synthase